MKLPGAAPLALALALLSGTAGAESLTDIYELALDLAAVSTSLQQPPNNNAAPSLQCCKGLFGGVDVLHIYGQLGLDCAAVSTCVFAAPCHHATIDLQ